MRGETCLKKLSTVGTSLKGKGRAAILKRARARTAAAWVFGGREA